jgi:hypothetical protein
MKNFDENIEWRINKDFHTQKEFFFDSRNNCLMDFSGRFENLDNDFKEICKKIKIHVQLPHLNKSRDNVDYLDFYSDYSVNMVNEAFKEDIELFGLSKPDVKLSKTNNR